MRRCRLSRPGSHKRSVENPSRSLCATFQQSNTSCCTTFRHSNYPMPTVVRESSAGFEGELRWPVHNPPTKAGDLIIFNEA